MKVTPTTGQQPICAKKRALPMTPLRWSTNLNKLGLSLFGVGEAGQAVTVLSPGLPRVR